MIDDIAVLLPIDKIEWHTYFLSIALVVSSRSDCTRRQYGCIAVSPSKRVVATGYNSPPAGVESAVQKYKRLNGERPPVDFPCCKHEGAPHNSGYDTCNALHAEHNCLMELGTRNHYKYVDLYLVGRDGRTGEVIDSSPCILCARAIANFNVRYIYCLRKGGKMAALTKDDLTMTLPSCSEHQPSCQSCQCESCKSCTGP